MTDFSSEAEEIVAAATAEIVRRQLHAWFASVTLERNMRYDTAGDFVAPTGGSMATVAFIADCRDNDRPIANMAPTGADAVVEGVAVLDYLQLSDEVTDDFVMSAAGDPAAFEELISHCEPILDVYTDTWAMLVELGVQISLRSSQDPTVMARQARLARQRIPADS